MVRKLLVSLPLLFFAALILFISVLRAASLRYDYQGKMNADKTSLSVLDSQVEYNLPNPGTVLPDSAVWPIKVIRDRLWVLVTTDENRKAELLLLFADKRLGSAKILFERNAPDLGIATLEKAQMYLWQAYEQERVIRVNGGDTTDFLDRLLRASLKHYELMERIYESAPDETRPAIIRMEKVSQKVYEDSRNALLEKGIRPYQNPFPSL